MSTRNNLPLTREQEELLKELEEEFKDRYTENDEEFMAVFNEKPSEPPVLENWYEQNYRNRDRGDHYRQDNDRRRDYHYHEGDRRDYYERCRGYHAYDDDDRRDYNDSRYRYAHSSRGYHQSHSQKPY